jgi:hypothetical protein
MGYPKLSPIITDNADVTPAASLAAIEGPWLLLAGLGVALSVVGGADLLLAWIPQAFGNPEWEFGTVSSTFDGLPVPTMGLILLTGAALVRRSRWAVRALSFVHVGVALLLMAAAVLYLTDVPLALRSIQDPSLRVGLVKAMVKTGVQIVVYPSLFFWVAAQGRRHMPLPRAAAL